MPFLRESSPLWTTENLSKAQPHSKTVDWNNISLICKTSYSFRNWPFFLNDNCWAGWHLKTNVPDPTDVPKQKNNKYWAPLTSHHPILRDVQTILTAYLYFFIHNFVVINFNHKFCFIVIWWHNYFFVLPSGLLFLPPKVIRNSGLSIIYFWLLYVFKYIFYGISTRLFFIKYYFQIVSKKKQLTG